VLVVEFVIRNDFGDIRLGIFRIRLFEMLSGNFDAKDVFAGFIEITDSVAVIDVEYGQYGRITPTSCSSSGRAYRSRGL